MEVKMKGEEQEMKGKGKGGEGRGSNACKGKKEEGLKKRRKTVGE